MNDQREVFTKLMIPLGIVAAFATSVMFLWAYIYRNTSDSPFWVLFLIEGFSWGYIFVAIKVLKRNGWFPFNK
ncbi:hypothetical protein ABMA70_03050 [Halobacteriovorax sp. XZX-3]|uniref:hypothetical protein n=1 Tax=unclassified Halobacteriovorax TaxID=2639665 RepID=UPI000CD20132|nr:hypothetical protein [Halobacteriovorax sp. DA5]POB14714.1 hypothetical protein C0Z22_06355 [Halobacteriovorax sp. DA5]